MLESKPTDSIFEVVWKQNESKELMCDLYRKWHPEDHSNVCSDETGNRGMVDGR